MLDGEAGIGKTTLFDATVTEAREHGFAVFSCRPAAAEAAFSFAALADLLAQRRTGMLEVKLIWDAETNGLCVNVRDTGGGDAFQLEVGPAEAMDAFHHPYAYAAARGIQYRRRERAGR